MPSCSHPHPDADAQRQRSQILVMISQYVRLNEVLYVPYSCLKLRQIGGFRRGQMGLEALEISIDTGNDRFEPVISFKLSGPHWEHLQMWSGDVKLAIR